MQIPSLFKLGQDSINNKNIQDLYVKINDAIIKLHYEVLTNVFTDIDIYSIQSLLPLWVSDAGHSQECAMSRELFEKLVKDNKSYFFYKCLYYYDFDMLVSSFQNRIDNVESMYNMAFNILSSDLKYYPDKYDGVVYFINEDSKRLYAYINTIVINLASCCDILTKIAIELSNIDKLDFISYPKMISSNDTYGSFVKLSTDLKKEGTIFTKPRPVPIAKIESMRDELVHNGSLDFSPNLYSGAKGYDVENWILMPDFNENGTFASFNGRKKFYSDCKKTMNSELPILVKDFLSILLETLNLILEKFHKEYFSNSDDFLKYMKEIEDINSSFQRIVGLKT